jgi:REP element-mobilizing transposase RayT
MLVSVVRVKPTAFGRATLKGFADPARQDTLFPRESPVGRSKSVRIHRELLRERRMTGLHFWATGYWVSTVGRDEETVRKYIREQEGWDRQQGELFE